jgi:protein gp37
MSDKSAIQWTEATWNPVTGCTKVSPGCAHCYIERTPAFRMAGRKFVRGATDIRLHPDRLDQPLRWKRPRMIFVNSLSDVFHEDVPDEFLDRMFAVMALARRHTFQVLTKRPERMLTYLSSLTWERLIECTNQNSEGGSHRSGAYNLGSIDGRSMKSRFVAGEKTAFRALSKPPLPNVWLGVTVENQRFADERIPLLLKTPAALRFLSCEPLLSALDLSKLGLAPPPSIDWVITGGESGGPADRRLVDGPFSFESLRMSEKVTRYLPKVTGQAWVTSLRDQCVAAGVPFFFKQWGGPRPTSGGRRLEGREWNEMPGVQAG